MSFAMIIPDNRIVFNFFKKNIQAKKTQQFNVISEK